MNPRHLTICVLAALACFAVGAQVPSDTIPRSASLPKTYPESWLFLHDMDYFNLINGKVVILDLAAEYGQHKGGFQASQLANFIESKRRGELYVTETVYSRVTRGERTDLITIYEKTNLNPIGEIVLPGNKRALMVPQKGAVQLTGDEKFLLVFNFTPAASVTVVDMDQRRIASEVPVPGCSLNYASGRRGFFALCANGTMASFVLDEKGQASGQALSEVFNDFKDDVLFMHPTTIAGITYLPTFHGHVRPIDTTGDKPKLLPMWSLTSAAETAVPWRPVIGQALTSDTAGRLYALMENKATTASDKPVTEVWVFDVKQKKRVARIALQKPGTGIEVTRGAAPRLAVVNDDGVDVYDALSGKFVRTIGGWISWTPSLLYASK